ncbi:MAG: hypothetical protein LBQ01_03860 [Prevotellaceae bacterium]|jgi:hypothetical protein|nr:hypothetical protein [Prevotellaceae bacterium]
MFWSAVYLYGNECNLRNDILLAVSGISNPDGSGNSASVNETLINTTTNTVYVTYVFTLTANGCTNIQNVSIPVYPTPTLSSSLTSSICSGTAFSYKATSATSGTAFSWTRAAVQGISNPAGSGNSATVNETLTNTTASPVNVTYVFTLRGITGCTNMQNVTVTVNPLPAEPIGSDVVTCYDGAPHTGSATVGTNETVVWYTEATGGTPTTAPSRTAVGSVTVYTAAKNTVTDCESATRTAVTVTVRDKPFTGTVSGEKAVCGDSV